MSLFEFNAGKEAKLNPIKPTHTINKGKILNSHTCNKQ